MGFKQQWTKMNISFLLLLVAISLPNWCCIGAFEIDVVKQLVTEWSPLVWLAPGEQFMPGDVDDFLKHVHPELPQAKPPGVQAIYDLNEHPDKYFEYMNDIKELHELQSNLITNRIKRNYRNPSNGKDGLLPIGEDSEKWFLVSNKAIEELRNDQNSFIFGKDPNKNVVPIYAVISPCTKRASGFDPIMNEITIDRKTYKVVSDSPNRYIPLQARSLNFPPQSPSSPSLPEISTKNETIEIVMAITVNETSTSSSANNSINPQENQILDYSAAPEIPSPSSPSPSTTTPMTPTGIPIKWAIEEGQDWLPTSLFSQKVAPSPSAPKPAIDTINGFHVTYWMFYPYSQGKVMCSIDLGVLGPIPIPLIFGFCFGERKEFGSHVGDWEHVSLFFSGEHNEPEEMYVSAHDAGAYYSYNTQSRLFEFRKQETRKGIFQKPSFPKTVRTSKNHPVLFSAEGSHGLWTAPGKHRYVRVPRLYDINGFGIPWTTWDNIKFFFSDRMEYDESTPNWLKYRGKWGNQKSKCHPLTRVGLHLCEISDGPTGIPRKKPHFKCSAKPTKKSRSFI